MTKFYSLLGKILSIVLICSVINQATVTAQTLKQTPITTKINSVIGGYYECLPVDYSTNTNKTYPVLIFIHGIGETGNGSLSQLPAVLRNGPPKLINEGKFPASFTVNGETSSFIVISPQFNGNNRAAETFSSLLDFVISKYRVDKNRIYLTGLSMGGGVTWIYGGTDAYAPRLAALAVVSGNTPAYDGLVRVVAKNNLPVWAFHNENDPTVPSSYTKDWISKLNSYTPKMTVTAKKTIFNASGHDAWTKAYDPNYKENNLNVYEWMLQYSRNIVAAQPPANKIPVANAGTDKVLVLPENSVALAGSGTDADGSITSYSWVKTSGPAQFTINNPSIPNSTISNLVQGTYTFRLTIKDNQGATAYDDINVIVNPSANTAPVSNAGADKSLTLPANSVTLSGSGTDANGSISSYAWTKTAGPTQYTLSSSSVSNPQVSNLVAGTYTFRLTVTDNAGATATDDINIVVSGAATSYVMIPGKIEAEQYAQMSGIQTEGTSDAGGGQDVGYVEQGDWMDYNVNVASTGNYTASFRLAAIGSASKLQIKNAAGVVLGTVNVPQTGGWQTWTTVNSTFPLVKGSQVLRIYASASGWNLNWLDFALTEAVGTDPLGSGEDGNKNINVNIYGGSNPYTNAAWNNWNISGASPAFKYSDGTGSTVKASISIAGSVSDNGASYPAGVAPAEVLRHCSYSTVQRTLTISGLSSSKTYDIELYASRSNNPGNSTVFSTSGTSQTVSTYNNNTQKALFTNQTANANGQMVITVSRLNTYNYINGFTLTEKGSSSSNLKMASVSDKPTEIFNIENAETFEIYPNPFIDQVVLQLNNTHLGKMNVFISDILGNIRKKYIFEKTQNSYNNKFIIGDLPRGIYMLKVQIGNWASTGKIIKN